MRSAFSNCERACCFLTARLGAAKAGEASRASKAKAVSQSFHLRLSIGTVINCIILKKAGSKADL